MELRDIEIFLTLADELHFGRTAERLHISSARVSQSIAKQERRIGTAMFARTSRRVELTAVGEQLRTDLEAGYRRILDGVAAAGAAGRGQAGTLTLGMMTHAGSDIAPVIDLFRARHPGCELRVREVFFSNPFGLLRAGEIDIAVVWFPVREPDLTAGPVLITMPVVLAVSTDHPLAARSEICLEDLADYRVMRSAHPIPDYWEEALQPRSTPTGRPIVRGPAVATWEEVIRVVATGQAVSFCGAEAMVFHPRPDITYRPVVDSPTLRWGLVWRTDAETPLVSAFVRAASEHDPVVWTATPAVR